MEQPNPATGSSSGMTASFDPASIERPDPALLKYYTWVALLTLIGFPFAFLPLYFKYITLRYKFDDKGVSMAWGVLLSSVALWFDASNKSRAFITKMGSPRSRTRVSAVLNVGSSVERTVSKTRSSAVNPVSYQPVALAGTSIGCAKSDCTNRRRVGFAIASVGSDLGGSVAATHGSSVNVTDSVRAAPVLL